MDTFVIGYLLYISTQVIRETVFRKGTEAKSINLNKQDNGTSILNGVYIAALCILPLILKYFDIGFILSYKGIGILGIFFIILGMIIHFIAIKTLGEFYTRTLKVTKDHSVIRTGIYKKIRHPGYLGTIVIGIGFGIASYNWILFLTTITLLILAYTHRIKSEEKMLIKKFGKGYEEYKKESWALIPYIL